MRENRPRRRASEVLTDGTRQTAMAMASGLSPLGLYVAEGTANQLVAAIGSECLQMLSEAEVREGKFAVQTGNEFSECTVRDFAADQCRGVIREVSPAVMEKIAYGQTSADVVGQFQWQPQTLDDLKVSQSPFFLVLDRIEKPGNVGAIFRTANAVGIDAVLLCGGGDLTHPNAIRNSQGAVFCTSSVACEWHQAHQWLASRGVSMLAARVESSDVIYEASLDGPVAIIVGNEADGLGDRWTSESGVRGIHIPMVGRVDSLNVGVSASLLVYEAFRRRRFG